MSDSTVDRLFLMLEAQAKLASKERHELVEAFERQITGLRFEVRMVAVIVAIVALAYGGTAVHFQAPGINVVTTPDVSTVDSTTTDKPVPFVSDPADAEHAPLE